MSYLSFTEAEQWATYYLARAYEIIRENPNASNLRDILRFRLQNQAEIAINTVILSSDDSGEANFTIAASGLVSAVPIIGSTLRRHLITDNGQVLYARKLMITLGLRDAAAAGILMREALALTLELPENSPWLAVMLKKGLEFLNDLDAEQQSRQLKEQLHDWWDASNIADAVDFELADAGIHVTHETLQLVHEFHLLGPIFKAVHGVKSATERLDAVATVIRERAIFTHQKAFVEVAIKRAIANAAAVKKVEIKRKEISTPKPKPPNNSWTEKVAQQPNEELELHFQRRPTDPEFQGSEAEPQVTTTTVREVRGAEIVPETFQIPLDEEWVISFSNKVSRGFYYFFRALELIFSILVLGVSADAVGIPNITETPPVLAYFLFTSIWVLLVLVYRVIPERLAWGRSVRVLIGLEVISFLNIFISAVVYSTACNYTNCMDTSRNHDSGWAGSNLLWFGYWGYNGEVFAAGKLTELCDDEFFALLFLWFLLISYMGEVLTLGFGSKITH